MIGATELEAPLDIEPNYLTHPYDRAVAIGLFRYVRQLFAQAPLEPYIAGETLPGVTIQSDDEIIDAIIRFGYCGYHAAGTCRMRRDPMPVVDDRLRVHGVSGLRVMDCSVMPTLVSGNTNGPVMA